MVDCMADIHRRLILPLDCHVAVLSRGCLGDRCNTLLITVCGNPTTTKNIIITYHKCQLIVNNDIICHQLDSVYWQNIKSASQKCQLYEILYWYAFIWSIQSPRTSAYYDSTNIPTETTTEPSLTNVLCGYRCTSLR